MSDNDSLRPEDFEPHRVEPERRDPRATIMAIFREQPLLRLGALILPVIVAVVVIISVFGKSKTVVTQDRVSGGSTISNPNGVEGSTNASYNKALEAENQRKIDEARAQGKDIIQATGAVQPQDNDQAAKDDLLAFNKTIVPPAQVTQTPVKPPEYTPAVSPQQIAPPPPPPPPVVKVDTQLAASFGNEMRTIIGGMSARQVSVVSVTRPGPDQAAQAAQAAQASAAAAQPREEGRKIIMAGTVVYGQTLIEADSDIPAPVLVNVLSGPLSGGRAIGSFQTVHAADDYLILAFGTIIRGQKEYKVNAIAMDPETTLTGLETDVDHHYFERFVLPAAAGFISGVGTYTQQAGSTTTVSNVGITQSYPPLNTHQELLSGLGQGANAIANAVQQESNLQPTVYVASGTGIGILFVNSVREVTE